MAVVVHEVVDVDVSKLLPDDEMLVVTVFGEQEEDGDDELTAALLVTVELERDEDDESSFDEELSPRHPTRDEEGILSVK